MADDQRVPDDDQVPDDGRHAFGDVMAAADAFERAPFIAVVTDGPELRTVAFNAAARAITEGRLTPGKPLLETVPQELMGQGWPEMYATPTLTGQTVRAHESRIQVHQPSGQVQEIYLDVDLFPRLDADGRPRGTIMTCQDVTQRVQDRAAAQVELEDLRDRYAAARGSVRALQQALLASSVPILPAVDVAARYLLADGEDAAGGDWFDAVERADGSVVLVVGDVVGHGQAAAVAMGQLRTVLLSQLRAGSGLVEALEFLDGFAHTVPAARRATVCVAHLDAGGDLEYCTAGHPTPLLLAAEDALSRYLPPTGGGPLATGAEFTTERVHLDVGEAVVLYSDGILERPGTTPTAAALALRTTAGDAQHNRVMPVGAPSSAAERICSLTLELLTRMSGYDDDITILAAQRRPALPDLTLDLEVGPDAARQSRAALRAWLDELAPGPRDTEGLLHAATELVDNVVDHAHLGSAPRPFRLRAWLEPTSRVGLEVVDQGSWKLPLVTGSRGRGLGLVRQLVDELHLDRSAGGTTATVRHTVSRAAGLLDRPGPRPHPVDPERFDVWADGGPEPVVTLIGPLDAATTPEVEGFLGLAVTEAAAVVTVDLTDVTLLASAGVDLLFRISDQVHALGQGLVLIAPNGSPAQHVLTLVGLPHLGAVDRLRAGDGRA